MFAVFGMTIRFSIRQIKYQSAFADIGKAEAQLVANKRSQLFRLGSVKHGVNAFYHAFLLFRNQLSSDTILKIELGDFKHHL